MLKSADLDYDNYFEPELLDQNLNSVFDIGAYGYQFTDEVVIEEEAEEEEEEEETEEHDNLDIDDVEYDSTETTISIKWDTNNDADSKVKYGTADGHLDEEEKSSKEENHHKIVLENLTPNTTYFFRIYSEDEYGDEEKTKAYSITTKKDYSYYSSSATVPVEINPEENSSEEDTSIFKPREYQSFESLKADLGSEENQEQTPIEKLEEKKEEVKQESKSFIANFFIAIWNFIKGLFGK